VFFILFYLAVAGIAFYPLLLLAYRLGQWTFRVRQPEPKHERPRSPAEELLAEMQVQNDILDSLELDEDELRELRGQLAIGTLRKLEKHR
jgi:hypothetical protein